MNNNLLKRAEQWLSEMGIQTVFRGNLLLVNRSDIMNTIGTSDESFNHNEILVGLKDSVSPKLFWASKDDEYLYLDSF